MVKYSVVCDHAVVYCASSLDDAILAYDVLRIQDATEGVYHKDYLIVQTVDINREEKKLSVFGRFLKWLDDKASCGY